MKYFGNYKKIYWFLYPSLGFESHTMQFFTDHRMQNLIVGSKVFIEVSKDYIMM